MPTHVTLPYNGPALDRAGAHRTDPDWVRRTLSRPESTAVVLWRDACLTDGEAPLTVHPAGLTEPVFLGMDGAAGVFAADLSELTEAEALAAAGATGTRDVRRLFPALRPEWAARLAYARGILHWHRNQRFCGACGGSTTSRHAGHLRVCDRCGKLLFPRIEPAVIVLVEAPDPPSRCLLARHRGAGPDSFSTLAGFVEIGESLADAVRRELVEEAGVRVSSVRYQASQAWPFPAGLMIGFRAVALCEDSQDEVRVDENELEEARWFGAEEVAGRLASGDNRVDSIEHFLIESWLRETR